jgi:NAD(P)-dependent dehydrogenase (short-subunit alcohol dehydrogenase family)
MTATPTIVVITGVGRGIGHALALAYLAQPNTIVIGSVRNKADPKYQDLKSSPAATGSKLILVTIESSSQTDPQQAVEDIKAAGINHVDIAIANAGFAPPPAPPETVEIKDMEETFRVNTLGPLILFRALKPLLDKSSAPKWISISSVAGSIANIEAVGTAVISAYGVAKAGLNWITA